MRYYNSGRCGGFALRLRVRALISRRANLRNMRLALGLIAAAAVSQGCRGSDNSGQKGAAPVPPGVKQMAMNVVRNRMINGEAKTDRVDSFQSPTAEEVEKQIKAVDWVN